VDTTFDTNNPRPPVCADEVQAMLKVILARLQQGHRTMKYPDGPPPPMPDRFRGRPTIDEAKCPEGCRACAEACPTNAITLTDKARIDLGKCLFCTDCINACPEPAISYTTDYRLAVRQRNDLVIDQDHQTLKLAAALDVKLKKLFGRSLKLRQVSAGGCNACEADVNVLNTVGWDLSRFGIQFVASPRHADGLLITGPVTTNMELALKKTYDAVPEPKIVIAVGACAIAGGPYINHEQVNNGADAVVPVDLYIPGCPPHPLTVLDGLLRLLGRLEDRGRPASIT
jgi:Ni,Fe-hydrogenase III small subunit/formate hydrogenlyase subunit 6/NADH:ubiquinone oxidoreductase subunit I